MYYYPFNQYLREQFGEKVRRISLDAGFGCPNKDNVTGRLGCVFCNELGFTNFAGGAIPLKDQIACSIARAKTKFGTQKFIAYFQNGTNTNARPAELKKVYDVIKGFPEIVGLYISTRPDCIDDEKLGLIASYAPSYDVCVEYGLQSVHDKTLKFLNRGHTFEDTRRAVEKTHKKGVKAAVHVMLGLPGETDKDINDTAAEIARMPIFGVKLHVLHILKDTQLEKLFLAGKIKLMERAEYVNAACNFLERINPDCVILRLVSDAKKEYLTAPEWINDKLSVINQIEEEFKKRNTRQGYLFTTA
ncbi:MAG: TIGR01212 family radical SAM protein [Candidatus Omnitrophota bacterium]